jgi:hypothetical protein
MGVVLAVGAVILLAMICVSGYGWITLPRDSRVPAHFGPGAFNNLVSKRVGLVLHPAAGVVVYLICALEIKQQKGSASEHPVWYVLLIAMCVLLAVQIGAINVARRQSRP